MSRPDTFVILTDSWYNIRPTAKRHTASRALQTICPVLMFHPALYRYMLPASSPTIAMPRTKDVQLMFLYCVKIFLSGLSRKNSNADTAAPTRYVTVSDANGLRFSGVDFEQI